MADSLVDEVRTSARHGGVARGMPDSRTVRIEATIARPVGCRGIGLHGGQPAAITLRPGPSGTGIVFRRVDLEQERGRSVPIPARYDAVVDTRLCTVLAAPSDPTVRVGTVEHLLAALAASGIDNLVVDVDGPEIPIMDGSALPFLDLLARAGRATGDRPVRPIIVRRPVRVARDTAHAALLPSPCFSFDVSIEFAAAAIGRQSLAARELTPASFRATLGAARTFTLRTEIDALHRVGLARGGSLENAVVVDDGAVLNRGGLRMGDEFVRHKALDAVGDLALAGAPIQAHLVAHRPGHALTNALLHALFADEANWTRGSDAVPATPRARRAA